MHRSTLESACGVNVIRAHPFTNAGIKKSRVNHRIKKGPFEACGIGTDALAFLHATLNYARKSVSQWLRRRPSPIPSRLCAPRRMPGSWQTPRRLAALPASPPPLNAAQSPRLFSLKDGTATHLHDLSKDSSRLGCLAGERHPRRLLAKNLVPSKSQKRWLKPSPPLRLPTQCNSKTPLSSHKKQKTFQDEISTLFLLHPTEDIHALDTIIAR